MPKGRRNDSGLGAPDGEHDFDDDAEPGLEQILEQVERSDGPRRGGVRRQLLIRRQLEDLADHRRFKELFDEL